jgi:hypothetical protein
MRRISRRGNIARGLSQGNGWNFPSSAVVLLEAAVRIGKISMDQIFYGCAGLERRAVSLLYINVFPVIKLPSPYPFAVVKTSTDTEDF